MAFRFDPRGDLPVPIIQNTSFYHRPDSTLSRYDQRRSGAYVFSPPKKKTCYDWIFSSASNVHIAVDRSAFKKYVSFKSYVLAVADQRQVPVKGIGTVELKIRRQPGGRESHRITLENVLHVPWLCNILSDVYFQPAKDYEHNWTDVGVNFQKLDGERWKPWGYTENFCGLDKLVLARKLDGRSPMLEDKEREVFSVNVMWPQSQRDKWERLIALEMKMEAEEHEANTRADATMGADKKSPLNKVVQLKKSLPDISQLNRDLRSGLSVVDPNVSSVKHAPSRVSSLKATTGRSAFQEALAWRKSAEHLK
jgi:hypothetical protein